MKQIIFKTILLGVLCLSGLCSMAQSAPARKTFTYLIYHKLSPGLTIQDALPVEREWRAINQVAVDEGKLIGWYMMVKQMSSNTNPTEYDYVTVIVSPDMSIKGASPAGMAKIYGDNVKTRMDDLQKRDRATAPVVKMEIWETVDAMFGPGFAPDKTPLMVVDFMKLRDPAVEWTSLIAPMKRFNTERIKRNAITGWGLSSLVVPKGSEKGYSLISFQNVENLSALASQNVNEPLPSPDVVKLHNQLNRTFDAVRQEVFRFTEYTK